jgi:hypothetical protein
LFDLLCLKLVLLALFTLHAAKGYMLPRDTNDFSICGIFYQILDSFGGNRRKRRLTFSCNMHLRSTTIPQPRSNHYSTIILVELETTETTCKNNILFPAAKPRGALAAQGSSRCSSGNLIAARQANLAARLCLGGYAPVSAPARKQPLRGPTQIIAV